MLSASTNLDSNMIAQEVDGKEVDATPADKARMELGELVVSVLQRHDHAERKSGEGEDYGVFESYFDLTRPRLKFIFHTLDQLCMWNIHADMSLFFAFVLGEFAST